MVSLCVEIVAVENNLSKFKKSLYRSVGGRDKCAGPILQFPSESQVDDLSVDDVSTCLTYLARLPRYVVWLYLENANQVEFYTLN